jgi:poly(A) polymerase
MKEILTILQNSVSPYDDIMDLYRSGELTTLCPPLYNLSFTEDGHKNNFIHTMQVLRNVCDKGFDYKMKIVAVFHDIGKVSTKRKNDKGEWTFHDHENVGSELFIELSNDLDDANLIDYVYRMIKYHGRIKMHRDVSESAIRRLDKEVGSDIIFDLIEFCKCDITTKFSEKKDRIVSGLDEIKKRIIEVRAKDEYDAWKSPLTGHVIMELLGNIDGKEIGRIKKYYDQDLRYNKVTLEYVIEEIKKGINF